MLAGSLFCSGKAFQSSCESTARNDSDIRKWCKLHRRQSCELLLATSCSFFVFLEAQPPVPPVSCCLRSDSQHCLRCSHQTGCRDAVCAVPLP